MKLAHPSRRLSEKGVDIQLVVVRQVIYRNFVISLWLCDHLWIYHSDACWPVQERQPLLSRLKSLPGRRNIEFHAITADQLHHLRRNVVRDVTVHDEKINFNRSQRKDSARRELNFDP